MDDFELRTMQDLEMDAQIRRLGTDFRGRKPCERPAYGMDRPDRTRVVGVVKRESAVLLPAQCFERIRICTAPRGAEHCHDGRRGQCQGRHAVEQGLAGIKPDHRVL